MFHWRSVRTAGKRFEGNKGQNTLLFRSFHHSPSALQYFDKILIANRGEIACRVIRTAKRLGIKTVAIYSTPDRKAKHVQLADEAVHVGGPLSSESYLNMDNILEAVKKTGAQAVHPGYGFLSENHFFAEELEKSGIAFIGPTSSAIAAMGDKIESKKLATKAGVHIIPGKLTDVHSVEEVLEIARNIGYPVMVKASAGGGGKGMRVAWNDQEAAEGFQLAKQEAKSAFGDDRILIEKYIDNPRHIEIQILGDSFGNAVYLNERECSIQRRNQKVLEEAPSSFIDPSTRKAMGAQAVALAQAVKYRSAGTVEFLVDPQRNFYFLEMNTRLQVEHPITEYITGLDLVEEMIKVAAGKPLSFKQEDVKLKGWAMEARVYAEDPLRNFLPSIGFLEQYVEPSDKEGNVRVDSGVRDGDEISIYYDPLISKLVTYGPTRMDAINRMATALDSYIVRGVNHNICFLRDVMGNHRYQSGAISTKFIPQEFPEGFKGHKLTPAESTQIITATTLIHYMREESKSKLSAQMSSFKFSKNLEAIVTLEDKDYNVNLDSRNGFQLQIDGKNISVSNTNYSLSSPIFKASIDNQDIILQLLNPIIQGYRIQFFGSSYDVKLRTARERELASHMPVKQRVDQTKLLTSPMPGRIVNVFVKPGDAVGVGQPIIIVEAMKMQNVLRAARDCVVKAVNVKVGSDVVVDQELVLFE